MLSHAVLLHAVVTAHTPTPTPIHHVTVEQATDSAQVIGYGDRDGDGELEPVIEIAVWHAEGEPRLAATLPDGAYLFVSINDGEAAVDSHDGEAVEAQLGELNAKLEISAGGVETASWLDCGLAATATVMQAAAANPWCIGSAILAACECLPLIVDEFEGMHCPLLD